MPGDHDDSPHTLLSKLDVGSPVAEHDSALESYFVETSIFRNIVEDRVDVVSGDKGTGKTALFSILLKRYTQVPGLESTELLPAFNPAGTPVFQRLLEAGNMQEGNYVGVWKAYLLALAGNWLIEFLDTDQSPSTERLEKILRINGLRSKDVTPQTVFSQLVNRIKSLGNLHVETGVTFTADGIPILMQKLSVSEESEPQPEEQIPVDEALQLLNTALGELDLNLWLLMDRLDEAFQSFPATEIPALRALFRTYLDLQMFEHIRLKLFVRNDLFGRIIEGGFVNLTHVNARRVSIVWDDQDLFDLIVRRIRESSDFASGIASVIGHELVDQTIFNALFPLKVDLADRKPLTWTWILNRIRDGNDVKSPRNLVTLVINAQNAQLKRTKADADPWDGRESLISGESMKRGLSTLSSERVEDTLLAEAGADAKLIELFRNGKSEHNNESLQGILGAEWADDLKILRRLGFMESIGQTYKVPMLYRDGLAITQGKAFVGGETVASVDDDET